MKEKVKEKGKEKIKEKVKENLKDMVKEKVKVKVKEQVKPEGDKAKCLGISGSVLELRPQILGSVSNAISLQY